VCSETSGLSSIANHGAETHDKVGVAGDNVAIALPQTKMSGIIVVGVPASTVSIT
jgi:hypothetical protein